MLGVFRSVAGKGLGDESGRGAPESLPRWPGLELLHFFSRVLPTACVPAGAIRLQEAVPVGLLPGQGQPVHSLRELQR